MRLAGKRAVITGAGSGFGEGIARKFAAEGATVAIAEINEEAGRRVAGEIGGSAIFTPVDVADDASVATMTADLTARLGGIDILVNNAGWTTKRQSLLDVSEADFDRMFAVNCKSIFLTARHIVPVMQKAGGGVIINIASTAGVRPRPGLTWYNSTKGAAITMTKSMAGELAGDRIRVNAVNPVIGATGLLESFMGMPDTPENRESFLATIPLGRMSEPRDIANAACYLASDEADFITGVCMEVDGGRCI
jgi:3-oxoacyl-[acyl-carrier protein] reductase